MAEERAAAALGLNNVADGVEVPSSRWLPNPQYHHQKLYQHPRAKPACPRPATVGRQHRKWVTGGPGMQAVFLDSNVSKKSSGTGVFLPQIRPPNNTHQLHPNKKPVCSRPVLLPSRVVQALNLNVHDLGLKITGSRKEFNEISMMKKKVEDQKREEEAIWESITEKECLLPDIFLPKEWTY